MLAVKFVSWNDLGEESIIHETDGLKLTIIKCHYTTHTEYWQLLNEKFAHKNSPFDIYGDPPKDNTLAYRREFVFIGFFKSDGIYYCAVMNEGHVYVLQNGKTIENIFVNPQNKSEIKIQNSIN